MKREHEIQKQLKLTLPPERFEHSIRVTKIAEQLAIHYQADNHKVQIAALLHDCSRFLDPDQMLKKAEELKFLIDPVQKKEPKLLHARLSAYFAKHQFGVSDQEILRAIESHTVGNNNMSLIDKIVYLADHIEDERNYKGIEKVKRLAFENLDQAVVESLNSMIDFIRSQDSPVHKKTIESRDRLL